ncbi:hypothetical protein NEOKW01_2154, partial [Nematocida sp. AWRm80]
EAVRAEAGALAAGLSDEINKEAQLLRDGQDVLHKLNELGAQVVASDRGDKPEDELSELSNVQDALRKLRKQAETVDDKLHGGEAPKYVKHGLEGENLVQRVDQLLDQLIAKRKDLENKLQLATLAPVIDDAAKVVTEKVEALATAFPDNLNDQQQQLEQVSAQKRTLEDLANKLPEGPEGDAQREQIQWNLSRLGDWLKKLNDAVGEKAAALAAYLASKRAADEQLNKLNSDVDAAIAGTDDVTPQGLHDRINALDAEEARLNAIRSELADDKVHPDQLDADKRAELDNLRNAVDAAADKLNNARDQLRAKLNAAIAAEQLQADANHYHNDLAALVRQGHETLVDSSAIPTSFKDLADRIHDAADAASGVVASAIAEGDEPIVKPLADIIPEARKVQDDLNRRHILYVDFVNERDNANNQLDVSRQPLDVFDDATAAGLRPLQDAEHALNALKVSTLISLGD